MREPERPTNDQEATVSEITGTERVASARMAGAVTDQVDRTTAEDRQREAERRRQRADTADRSEIAQTNRPKQSDRASEENGEGGRENQQVTRARGIGNNMDIMA